VPRDSCNKESTRKASNKLVAQADLYWAVGYQQSGAAILPCSDAARDLGQGTHERTHVQVMVSLNYQGLLHRSIRNLQVAGDPVRLHIQPTVDYKDVEKAGFMVSWHSVAILAQTFSARAPCHKSLSLLAYIASSLLNLKPDCLEPVCATDRPAVS
jgi:hypothetical protein